MSILGPLTTTFTPPSSCISSMSDVFYQILAPSAFDGLLYGPLGAVCFPSGYQDIRRVYYSPGLFCPVGYETACISFDSMDIVTETVVTCCPTFVVTVSNTRRVPRINLVTGPLLVTTKLSSIGRLHWVALQRLPLSAG
jgi:hypothetical protein